MNTDTAKYMELPYDVRLAEKDGVFRFVIPELGLIGEGPSVEEAHEALKAHKQQYFTAMLEAGQADAIPLPSREAARKALYRAWGPFSIKLVVALLVFLFAAAAVVPVIQYQVKELERSAKIAGRALPRGIVEGMADLRALPPERQEKILKALRNYLVSIKPIIDEVQDALDDQGTAEGTRTAAPTGN